MGRETWGRVAAVVAVVLLSAGLAVPAQAQSVGYIVDYLEPPTSYTVQNNREVGIDATGLNACFAFDGGASSGAAILYEWSGTEYVWSKGIQGTAGVYFAHSVAYSDDGSLIAVGSPFDGAGSAAVYATSASSGISQEAAPPPGIYAYAEFGFDVALSGDGTRLLVGAPWDAYQPPGAALPLSAGGRAFVYRRVQDAYGAWQLEYEAALGGATKGGDSFGATVAIDADGDRVALSSLSGNAVLVFERNLADDTWSQVARLEGPVDGALGEWTGALSISAGGDLIAVADASSAAVLLYQESPTGWSQTPDHVLAGPSANFGRQVDVAATAGRIRVLASDPWASYPGSGAVYLRDYDVAAETWSEIVLVDPDAPWGSYLGFKAALSADGERVVASEESRAVVFGVSSGIVPGTPGNLSLVLDGVDLDVSWAAPTSDGGSTILRYEVVLTDGASDLRELTVYPPATAARFESLNASTTYSVSVAAVNAAGAGPAATDTVAVPALPAAPSLTLTPGDARVHATWTAPTGTILEYELRVDGVPVYFGTATEYLMEGMANGSSCAFAVRARNSVGWGAFDADGATPQALSARIDSVSGDPTLLTVLFQTTGANGTTVTCRVFDELRAIEAEEVSCLSPWAVGPLSAGRKTVRITATDPLLAEAVASKKVDLGESSETGDDANQILGLSPRINDGHLDWTATLGPLSGSALKLHVTVAGQTQVLDLGPTDRKARVVGEIAYGFVVGDTYTVTAVLLDGSVELDRVEALVTARGKKNY